MRYKNQITAISIKTIIILLFVFSLNVFADGYAFTDLLPTPDVSIRYDTNKAGMVRTKIYVNDLIDGAFDFEFFTIIHGKKGNLMFYKHYLYKKGLLTQITEDGILISIVSGDTDCDFKVIESSGDIVSFQLDPKKEPKRSQQQEDEDIVFFKHLKEPKVPTKNKYDEIIYNRWTIKCVYTIGYEDPVYSLEQENESDIDVENNDDSLSYPLPYKYYLIIALCIIATSVVVMRKKWKVRK
jgi:hypothetical protein